MGIKNVILPKATGQDLQDISEAVRNEPVFVQVETVEEILKRGAGVEQRRTGVLRAGSSIIPVQNV
ncbi:MAG: S16 family serine protease [Methanoregula sp.]|nr:S16 family serine protease [Methanoregula sp.]